MTIGEKIKKRREEIGLTQSELARKCILPPTTIWNIENGKRKPGLKSILRIADALGVCLDSLVKEELMMNPQIMELCRKVQQLSEESRKKIITFANRIYNQEKKKNNL